MTLVDTSVWVDHLRKTNATLVRLLEEGEVLCHPFVIGELSLGRLEKRAQVLSLLEKLPAVGEAQHREVLLVVHRHDLSGSGIGWIDAHLLASALLAKASLWTLDRRLAAAARSTGVARRV